MGRLRLAALLAVAASALVVTPANASHRCSGTAYGGFYSHLRVNHASCHKGRVVMRRWARNTNNASPGVTRHIRGFTCHSRLRNPPGPNNQYLVVKCHRRSARIRFEGHS